MFHLRGNFVKRSNTSPYIYCYGILNTYHVPHFVTASSAAVLVKQVALFSSFSVIVITFPAHARYIRVHVRKINADFKSAYHI